MKGGIFLFIILIVSCFAALAGDEESCINYAPRVQLSSDFSFTNNCVGSAGNIDAVRQNGSKRINVSDFDLEDFHGLVILVDFMDRQFMMDDPKSYFEGLFNTENLDAYEDPLQGNMNIQGSVYDYFSDMSNGSFRPIMDVYGPYRAPYYSMQVRGKENELVKSILANLANNTNDDLNFGNYDRNHDGYVDEIMIILAGYNSSYDGNNAGYWWTCYWNIDAGYWPRCDNLAINKIVATTELHGFEAYPSTVSAVEIEGACLAISHMLGFPIINGVTNCGLWDVLAGVTLQGYSLVERYALGWADVSEITETGTYTLDPVSDSGKGYILRTPVDNEFFLIENRQRTGWDHNLPGHGMIITRVDSVDMGAWPNINGNCFEILCAGNEQNDYSGKASVPFPGTSGNLLITNETAPNLLTKNGRRNKFVIIGIKESHGVITFDVAEDTAIHHLVEDFEMMPITSSSNGTNVTGNFASWTFNKSEVCTPDGDMCNGLQSVKMKLPSQFYSESPIYFNSIIASFIAFNASSTTAKYTLELSVDRGASWIKAEPESGIEVPAKSQKKCCWYLGLNKEQPVQFRVAQVAGNRNVSTYIDDFTIYYSGEAGGAIDILKGDVNGDNEVNVADVDAIISIILGFSIESNDFNRADLNDDGEVNISDVNAVIAIILN